MWVLKSELYIINFLQSGCEIGSITPVFGFYLIIIIDATGGHDLSKTTGNAGARVGCGK